MCVCAMQRSRIKRRSLHQRIVFRRRVDVCADARDRTIGRFEFSHAKVGDLNGLLIRGEQKVLRLDIAMNHPAFVRVREPGADLLKIKKRTVQPQWLAPAERRQITAAQVFEHDVVKRRAGEIDRRAVPQPADDVWMTNAIKRSRFVLEILNQSALEFGILIALEQHVEGFDYYGAKTLISGRPVTRDVDFGVAAATEAVFNVVPTIEPALQKFEFGHYARLLCNPFRQAFLSFFLRDCPLSVGNFKPMANLVDDVQVILYVFKRTIIR